MISYKIVKARLNSDDFQILIVSKTNIELGSHTCPEYFLSPLFRTVSM